MQISLKQGYFHHILIIQSRKKPSSLFFFFFVERETERERGLHYFHLFHFTVSGLVASLIPPVQAVLSLSVVRVRVEAMF